MIDTIILQIPINSSAIINSDQFKPSARMIENVQGFFKCVNNPTTKDKKEGVYKPRLTIIKRGARLYLKVEFSAPKMLFGNNLEEIKENSFEALIKGLQEKIKQMGVELWSHEIEKAEVIGIHPSKNILLNNGYTSSFVIRELSKINLNQKFDLERVSFRNDGESMQFYTNQHSFVLYDKIKDLNKPAKRAIDKEQTSQQISLFEYIEKEKKNIEVLRLEIRIGNKKKLSEILRKVNYTESSIFTNIFKEKLCQKIIKLYWEEFFGKNMFLFNVNNNPQVVLQKIIQKYPKTNIKTAIMLVGLNLLCRDDSGIRGFRSIAKNYKPKFNWTILNNYLRKFEDEIFIHPTHGFIRDIETSLDNFEAFMFNRK
jgi:hypothetical protein